MAEIPGGDITSEFRKLLLEAKTISAELRQLLTAGGGGGGTGGPAPNRGNTDAMESISLARKISTGVAVGARRSDGKALSQQLDAPFPAIKIPSIQQVVSSALDFMWAFNAPVKRGTSLHSPVYKKAIEDSIVRRTQYSNLAQYEFHKSGLMTSKQAVGFAMMAEGKEDMLKNGLNLNQFGWGVTPAEAVKISGKNAVFGYPSSIDYIKEYKNAKPIPPIPAYRHVEQKRDTSTFYQRNQYVIWMAGYQLYQSGAEIYRTRDVGGALGGLVKSAAEIGVYAAGYSIAEAGVAAYKLGGAKSVVRAAYNSPRILARFATPAGAVGLTIAAAVAATAAAVSASLDAYYGDPREQFSDKKGTRKSYVKNLQSELSRIGFKQGASTFEKHMEEYAASLGRSKKGYFDRAWDYIFRPKAANYENMQKGLDLILNGDPEGKSKRKQKGVKALALEGVDKLKRGDVVHATKNFNDARLVLKNDRIAPFMWKNPEKVFAELDSSRIANRNWARAQCARARERSGD